MATNKKDQVLHLREAAERSLRLAKISTNSTLAHDLRRDAELLNTQAGEIEVGTDVHLGGTDKGRV